MHLRSVYLCLTTKVSWEAPVKLTNAAYRDLKRLYKTLLEPQLSYPVFAPVRTHILTTDASALC
ncbi:hypothetical protein BJ085DRAFT_34689 [Dimargaris cristalligena]|uniref:Reverse transcriptase/retrotransposon-derived protein RNase H-like domain-containing protein n=1 Tax=Dimargaris cristalligena TaxID=215637 RepID=A0A4P9ZLM2_9FUNG|nr:hypothetical protein BJ085DRAFT_34689 [Dimargaris cristalligena]|eukprot:RKP33110.1 hypothetical protein BJ085DRAFT_34689 [Dimargaris cristalligena]